MLFNSLEFVLFFPVVVVLYFIIPHRWRWLWLLIASYVFYMAWRAEYAVLLLVSTVVDYFASRRMANLPDKKARKPLLYLSLVTNIGLLFSFKYLGFLNESLRGLFGLAQVTYPVPVFDILLPVGISFYTFQTLSYTIDVYRGTTEPEKHFGIFALYVSFWPQLVAGPIERSKHLLPQLRENHYFDYDRVRDGLIRMLWGFFKKLVIADRLAYFVAAIYQSPDEYGGGTLLLATFMFTFQIYCDFSGYSDIAIGAAKIMGFDLVENFMRPYFSRSIVKFWNRWHMSLYSWFNDYIFFPLVRSHMLRRRWRISILLTFMLSGIWHGAAWTFAFWGLLQGVIIVVARGLGPKVPDKSIEKLISKRVFVVLQIVLTFTIVMLGLVSFRASSIGEAFRIWGAIFTEPLNFASFPTSYSDPEFVLGMIGIFILMLFETLTGDQPVDKAIRGLPTPTRWVYYGATCLAILLFGVYTNAEFIYFQF